jgi:hypothetical protein
MKRHLLYYFSPCILVAIVVLVKIVIGFQALLQFISWRFYTPMIQIFSAFLVLVIVDWPVKKYTKGNVIYIWIIEAILISIGLFFFRELRYWLLG